MPIPYLAARSTSRFSPSMRSPASSAPGKMPSQYGVHPDSVHAGLGEPLQQSFRIGRQFGIGQRIAERRAVRVDDPQRETLSAGIGRCRFLSFAGGFMTSGKFVDECEPGRLGNGGCRPDIPDLRGDPGGLSFGLFGRLFVMQRRAIGFPVTQFYEQVVVFDQPPCQFLARDAEQREQLVVWQQVPVPPQYGDISLRGVPFGFDRLLRRKAHRFGQRTDIFDRGFEHFGQFPGRDERPVAPYERVLASREPGRFDGGRRSVFIGQRCGRRCG